MIKLKDYIEQNAAFYIKHKKKECLADVYIKACVSDLEIKSLPKNYMEAALFNEKKQQARWYVNNKPAGFDVLCVKKGVNDSHEILELSQGDINTIIKKTLTSPIQLKCFIHYLNNFEDCDSVQMAAEMSMNYETFKANIRHCRVKLKSVIKTELDKLS